MLPKKYRLTENKDFSAIYSKGFYGACDGIAIKYLDTKSSATRIGFSVGKNFSKKAVERNRAKRILRAACLPYAKTLKPGFDIVIMIKPKTKVDSIELAGSKDSLRQIFKKANLIIE